MFREPFFSNNETTLNYQNLFELFMEKFSVYMYIVFQLMETKYSPTYVKLNLIDIVSKGNSSVIC